MSHRRTVADVYRAAQRLGTLGDRPIEEVIDHARQFVMAVPKGATRVIDLGTGAGVPGLVIADDRPELALTLVDRRETRMDALRQAVAGLGWQDRVTVLTVDAEVLARDPEHAGTYDAVVCRGLAHPQVTAALARPFLKNGGRLIVSEPPKHDPSRWPISMCDEAHFGPPEYAPGVVILTAIA